MKIFLLSLLSFVLLSANEPFISAEKLNTVLLQNNLVLIDVGTEKDYLEEGHVLGAVRTDISEWRMRVDSYFLMRPESELVKKISELGISNDSMVVIYGHNKPKEVLKASYIALALKVYGHESVTILNGGFSEWIYDSSRPVSHKLEVNKPGRFKASRKDNIVVDKRYVLKNLNKIPMLESRPSDFYFGMLESPGVKRIGHISGGMSYFWKNSLEADETVKESDKLHEILVEGMQLEPSKEMMVYCTGGLEASMNWYILTQVLHFEDVKIYDASMMEWGNLDDTPMVKYRWEVFQKN